ncbi:COX5A-domain-containing protein [Cystobasidium minutum MCA 4210]|uniref:COX5A-domain-containing protein n=1 Tax=Cystobasidium minutum MCA 4210 TaxID=1397322 RepID=UPI0034CE64D4|eukprot:jgi/Rhomi1/20531/CE20530_29932
MSFLTGAISRAAKASVAARQPLMVASSRAVGARLYSSGHEEESYEQFTERYAKFFDSVEDTFELQRGLNNCFAYDLVPGAPIVESALKAARRLNDYPTAVRIFEGLKEKVENKSQYQAYLDEFASLRKELGVATKEELYGLPAF